MGLPGASRLRPRVWPHPAPAARSRVWLAARCPSCVNARQTAQVRRASRCRPRTACGAGGVRSKRVDPSYFARGVLLGFAIAAPVGPIGLLCIRRTLAYGRGVGLVTGLGAATADMLYGAVAAFGLTAVSVVLTEQRLWLHVLGSAALAYLGLRTLLSRPSES